MNRRNLRRSAILAVVATVMAFVGIGVAWAYFTATDATHSAQAAADSLPNGQTPTASISFSSGVATATITFSRAPTTSGRTVTAFLVKRYANAGGGTADSSFTCTPAGTGTLVSCSEPGVPAGTWYYSDTPTVAGSAWVGGESGRSNAITTDTTAPTVSYAQSPAANTSGYNNSAVVVTLTANDDAGGTGVASITYKVDSAASVQVNASTATFTVSAEGTHTITYTATDRAGNTSASAQQTLKIDSTPPTAPVITSKPAYINVANVGRVSFSGTAEPGATVRLTLSDGVPADTINATRTADAATGAWSVTSVDCTGLADGTVSVTVTATDVAGNVSNPGAQATVVKDTVAPSVTLTSTTNPIDNVNQASTAASGAVSDANGATVAVTATDGITTTAPKSATVTANSWNVAGINVTGLKNGSVTYSATATDAAGNTTTVSATAVKAAPTSYVFSSISTQTAGTSFQVTITARDGGGTLTTFSGSHAVTVSSTAGVSPSGATPVLPASPLTFASGVATVSVTLVKAETARTLSASDGTASGTSAAFSVQAGGASRLAWVNPNPSNATCLFTCAYTGAGGNGMTFKAGVQLTDDKGNPVAAASSITVTVSASAGSFTGSASVGITAGQSQSSTGGTGGASAGQITFKTESGSWTSDTLSMTSTPTFTGATASFSK